MNKNSKNQQKQMVNTLSIIRKCLKDERYDEARDVAEKAQQDLMADLFVEANTDDNEGASHVPLNARVIATMRKTRYEMPKGLKDLIFITRSKMERLGWWTGDCFFDRDNNMTYEKQDVLFWQYKRDLIPDDFYEEQALLQ